MKKKLPFILVGSLLFLGILGSILVLQRPDTSMVEIRRYGELLYRFYLEQEADQVPEIEYEGRINTVKIENHQIRMAKAECPDNTCVHMGWLDSSAPIVCLPNHLVIQFVEDDSNIDSIT